MNRFIHQETVPTRSGYAEALASGRAQERRNRRARTFFICLLPVLILAGWGAVKTIGKLFH